MLACVVVALQMHPRRGTVASLHAAAEGAPDVTLAESQLRKC